MQGGNVYDALSDSTVEATNHSTSPILLDTLHSDSRFLKRPVSYTCCCPGPVSLARLSTLQGINISDTMSNQTGWQLIKTSRHSYLKHWVRVSNSLLLTHLNLTC